VGRAPPALLILQQGQTATAEDIQSHLQQYVDNGTINKWAIPRHIDFVDDIPKTSVGKINKKLIRDQIGNDEAAG
jgi:fatty-acyl-CoA synthase